jgi:hypothetical protein
MAVVSPTSNHGGNPLGNGVIGAASAVSDLQKSPLLSPVAELVNSTGILKPVHHVMDQVIDSGLKTVEGVGHALGGQGNVDYHLKKNGAMTDRPRP